MTITETIYEQLKGFRPDWDLIAVIAKIERFDALWPSIMNNENVVNVIYEEEKLNYSLLEVFEIDFFSDSVYEQTNLFTETFLADLKVLRFWFETELKIHPLICCLLFGFFIKHSQVATMEYGNLGLHAQRAALIKSGYLWIKYIRMPDVCFLKIEEWLRSFLNSIRDGQLLILRKLDLGGTKSKLTSKELLLLYILETNAEIKTTAISRKLGLSRSSVKRMLNIFKEKKLIELRGINRATHYRVL